MALIHIHQLGDVCMQQHILGKEFCNHLYPLSQFQDLVHERITQSFVSHTSRSSAGCSSVPQAETTVHTSCPFPRAHCSSLKYALSSYTPTLQAPAQRRTVDLSARSILSHLDSLFCSNTHMFCTSYYVQAGLVFMRKIHPAHLMGPI